MSYAEFYSARIVKSKKDRRCEWCGEKIEKLSMHVYVAAKWEGDFVIHRKHLECEEAFSREDRKTLDEGWEAGEHDRGKTFAEMPAERNPYL